MAKLSPDELRRDLKAGQFLPVYLLYGEDVKGIDEALAQVEGRVLGGGVDEFNADYFHGKESDPSQVVAAARTMPMMAERRLVVLRRVDELKAAAREKLLTYLADPSPETVLALSAGALALRGASTKKDDVALVKACDRAGAAVEFARPKPAQLPRVIEELARSRGKRIESAAVSILVDLVGGETLGLDHEVEKVCLYVGKKDRITKEDVLSAVADVKEASVFEFTDQIGSRDVEGALRTLRRLREQGQEHLMVLGMLLRHFRLLWQIADLRAQGEPLAGIAKKLKLNEWVMKKTYLPQVDKFPAADTGRIMTALADLDMKLKSTRGDREVLMERTVIALCTGRPG